MFKITSLRASDGGGAVRIDLKREDEAKGQSLYILAFHQREYEFAKGEYGKPYIVGYPIHYNISHSGQYVVLVTAKKLQRKYQKKGFLSE